MCSVSRVDSNQATAEPKQGFNCFTLATDFSLVFVYIWWLYANGECMGPLVIHEEIRIW
jgi:hypothetical protein